jgi:hypothetical protein
MCFRIAIRVGRARRSATGVPEEWSPIPATFGSAPKPLWCLSRIICSASARQLPGSRRAADVGNPREAGWTFEPTSGAIGSTPWSAAGSHHLGRKVSVAVIRKAQEGRARAQRSYRRASEGRKVKRASAPPRANAWGESTDSQPDEGSEVEAPACFRASRRVFPKDVSWISKIHRAVNPRGLLWPLAAVSSSASAPAERRTMPEPAREIARGLTGPGPTGGRARLERKATGAFPRGLPRRDG